MTKKKVVICLNDISLIKKHHQLDVIDTHIHPLDVMGEIHFSEIQDECGNHKDYLLPGILEMLNYSKFEKVLSRLFFIFFESFIKSTIVDTYKNVNHQRIIEELTVALVDKGVLLSLDPWAPTNMIGEKYSSDKKFFILGSLDIHSVEVENIERIIVEQIKSYKIVGLKLHPNLQNFMPQPKDNPTVIAEKLKEIYKIVEKYNLYILFHGGKSNYTSKINPKYKRYLRSRTNALLKNFCDINGNSEIFENYSFPVIIAHIGHYGIIFPNYKLIKIISDKYKHVYFDTSGVSSKVIKKTLKLIPTSKLIFGSDALYNRVAYNISFLYFAIKKVYSRNSVEFELAITDILSNNYRKIINK